MFLIVYQGLKKTMDKKTVKSQIVQQRPNSSTKAKPQKFVSKSYPQIFLHMPNFCELHYLELSFPRKL